MLGLWRLLSVADEDGECKIRKITQNLKSCLQIACIKNPHIMFIGRDRGTEKFPVDVEISTQIVANHVTLIYKSY